VDTIERELQRPLREGSAATALYLADRLSRADEQEVKLFAHVPLRRSLPEDPERSWQIVRRLMRRATDWVSVDSLADVVAAGILLEPYRWAELEQLVYSPHAWERRLVGSTVATLPFRVSAEGRRALINSPALALVRSLLGDSSPDVQKALSWALRSWYRVDPQRVMALLHSESEAAAARRDGYRAWVLRDALSLPSMDPATVAAIRGKLTGIRRQPGAASTSEAAEVTARFVGLPDAHALAEPPLAR